MTSKPKLSSFIVAEATEAELARQWAAIEYRLEPRRHRLLPLALALAGVAAVAIAYLLVQPVPPKQVSTRPNERVTLALDDGSRMQLRPASAVNLLRQRRREVHLQVLRGSARFEVRPNPARRFVVTAAGVDVVVTGTAFSVELEGAAGTTRVSVERGVVEVHPRGEVRVLARVHAGEAWPAARTVVPRAPAETPPAAPADQATKPSVPVAVPAAPAIARRPEPTDPRQLLEEANAARRNGDVARAASLLEILRVRHPSDARAALATFELGRLRMNALGDLPGAVQALKQSIALAPSGVFREDAEACLATAYARMRDRARCVQARQRYLERYPEGTHNAEMSALACPGR
jgi:hypothetical protein